MRAFIQVCLFSFFAFTFGCGLDSGASALSFSGEIKGADAIAITRVVDLNRGKVELVGRVTLGPDGSFKYSTETNEPGLYELNFPNGKKVQFVTERANAIEFAGSAGKPEEIEIKGSAANELLQKYEEFRKESLERLVKSVRKQIKEFPDKNSEEYRKLGRMEAANYTKHKEELLDFVKKNMGTSVAVYPTSLRWPADTEAVEPLVASFEKAHPDWEITKRMKEKLAVINQTSVGGTVPDISMRDETGNELTLFGSMGKYTLIDFWGSWCGPCRREADTLSRLYAKYKPDGFEIYGVGLESELKLWQEAKALDQRIWPNVVSLKEFDTEAAYDYAITSLPANFLIDKDGKVLAKDIHDEELEKKLEELFGGE